MSMPSVFAKRVSILSVVFKSVYNNLLLKITFTKHFCHQRKMERWSSVAATCVRGPGFIWIVLTSKSLQREIGFAAKIVVLLVHTSIACATEGGEMKISR